MLQLPSTHWGILGWWWGDTCPDQDVGSSHKLLVATWTQLPCLATRALQTLYTLKHNDGTIQATFLYGNISSLDQCPRVVSLYKQTNVNINWQNKDLTTDACQCLLSYNQSLVLYITCGFAGLMKYSVVRGIYIVLCRRVKIACESFWPCKKLSNNLRPIIPYTSVSH